MQKIKKSKKITQESLVKLYLGRHKHIVPAFISNSAYCGYWFGSEIARICRFMRRDKILKSDWVESVDGKKYRAFLLVNKRSHA